MVGPLAYVAIQLCYWFTLCDDDTPIDTTMWAALTGTALFSLTGGLYGGFAAAFACIADITAHSTAEYRARLFGVTEASLWLGLLVGPFLGGWVSSIVGLEKIFLVVAAGYAFDTCVVLLIHETRPKDPIEQGTKVESWGSWLAKANPLASLGLFNRNSTGRKMLLILGMVFPAQSAIPVVLPLYLEGQFSWDPKKIGALQSVSFGAASVGLLVVLPLLQRCGISVRCIMAMSLASVSVSIGAYVTVTPGGSGWQLFPIVAVTNILVSIYFPFFRALAVAVMGSDEDDDKQPLPSEAQSMPATYKEEIGYKEVKPTDESAKSADESKPANAPAAALGAVATAQGAVAFVTIKLFSWIYSETSSSAPHGGVSFLAAAGMSFLGPFLLCCIPNIDETLKKQQEAHGRKGGGSFHGSFHSSFTGSFHSQSGGLLGEEKAGGMPA